MSEEGKKDSGLVGVAGGLAGAGAAGYFTQRHFANNTYRDAAKHAAGTLKDADKLSTDAAKRLTDITADVTKKTTEAAEAAEKAVVKALEDAKLTDFVEKSKADVEALTGEAKTKYEADLKKYKDIIKPREALAANATKVANHSFLSTVKPDSVDSIHFIKGEDGKIAASFKHNGVITEIKDFQHVPDEVTKGFSDANKTVKLNKTDHADALKKLFDSEGAVAKNAARAEAEIANSTRKTMGLGNSFKHMSMAGKGAAVGAVIIGGVGVKMALDALIGSHKEGGYAAQIEAQRAAPAAEPVR